MNFLAILLVSIASLTVIFVSCALERCQEVLNATLSGPRIENPTSTSRLARANPQAAGGSRGQALQPRRLSRYGLEPYCAGGGVFDGHVLQALQGQAGSISGRLRNVGGFGMEIGRS